MTTVDKANLIQLIEWYEYRADNARRCAQQQPIQYCAGWLDGTGNARREIADDLRKLLEAGEVEV